MQVRWSLGDAFLDQRFLQKISRLSVWIIRQLAKYLITQSLIKRPRLETKRVYPGMVTSPGSGKIFSLLDQSPSPALATQLFGNPQNFNSQPAPKTLPDKTADDFPLIPQEQGNLLRLPDKPSCPTEFIQGHDNRRSILWRKVFRLFDDWHLGIPDSLLSVLLFP